MYKTENFLLLAAAMLLLFACNGPEPETHLKTHIHGQITVDAELDTTRDYAGIELLIVEPDASGESRDTLFHSLTNREGYYEGDARFSHNYLYTLILSRHNQELAYIDLVLSEDDTVQFNVELPDVENSLEISSLENDLYESYNRLRTGVNRLYQFAGTGAVSADTLGMELTKWSNLFWDLYQDNKEAFAGRQAALSSIRLLENREDEIMMERLREAVESDHSFVPFASGVGVRYYAENNDLDHALAYLDSLDRNPLSEQIEMDLKMNRIKLLYDSARVEKARLELDQFKEKFSENHVASSWIERFEYDLESLAPGSELPEFEIVTLEGETLTNESMKGVAYILEFTRLDNRLYQEQFDRSTVIHHIYKNYGIDFITIPFGANEVVLNGFFEERPRLWPVVQPGSFDAEGLRDNFNINMVPTRILVDQSGLVVRKYEGTEFNDIIRGLQSVLNANTQDEPS